LHFECPLSRLFLIATCHRDVSPQTVVGGKNVVLACEIDSGFGHQSGQPGDEVDGLEDYMSGALSIGRFQFIAHLALGGLRRAFKCCNPTFRGIPE
jgi:hypothetical protein